ncbi:CatB-related O-acetyltransferase [Pseudarthrobacter oxydans]|uniref:CatB-related O-acetyltransferase n=1 Tax=Pseudarthrobacter oxydans TaxID=1671 RepID=UPI0037FA882B
MTSTLLRRYLLTKYDIRVGPHTYGSLLEDGMCDRKTLIGAYCSIGKNVRRYGAAHPIHTGSTHPYFYNPSLGYAEPGDDVDRTSISIGSDVWIGSNVTILPGCSTIGFGAVIGAGSIVTKDVPDFAVVVGNPARIISFRHTEQRRNDILSSKFWEKPPAEAQTIIKALGHTVAD